MSILNDISDSLKAGKAKQIRELVQKAVNEGISAKEILDKALISAMNEVGQKFKNNEIYVPEVLIAARAMNQGSEVLKPYLVTEGVKAIGKVCIGTVKNDLHDIGKNLCKMMMEGKGLEVLDLGTDVSPERFVEAAKNEGCKVICCSALLTTTMGFMKDVVEACKAEGIRDNIKIMIGGAPITQSYCDEIGADAYTPDAASCADVAASFFE